MIDTAVKGKSVFLKLHGEMFSAAIRFNRKSSMT